MQIGVSYNLFDGEELLLKSIMCLREHVDYINIIYQTTSNFGYKANEGLVDLVNGLYKNKIVDNVFCYEPNLTNGGYHNELTKRNIGLELCLYNGCDYFMSIDSDEFYKKEQLIWLKEVLNGSDYDSVFCKMMTYYKTGEYVLDPPEEYFVPVMYKVNNQSKFVFGVKTPVLVDPTRSMSVTNPLICDREQLQMHHFSYVRDNLYKKLENSSSSVIESMVKDKRKISNYYNDWEYPNDAMLDFRFNEKIGQHYTVFRKIKKVENYFNV